MVLGGQSLLSHHRLDPLPVPSILIVYGECRGPAPAGSRGTLRMNGVGERETRRTGLDRAKSAREREKEKKRPDQEYATESGSCFIFTVAFIP